MKDEGEEEVLGELKEGQVAFRRDIDEIKQTQRAIFSIVNEIREKSIRTETQLASHESTDNTRFEEQSGRIRFVSWMLGMTVVVSTAVSTGLGWLQNR